MCKRLTVVSAGLLALTPTLEAQTLHPRQIIAADNQIPVRAAPNPWFGSAVGGGPAGW